MKLKMTTTQQEIVEVCNSVRELLLVKNRKYGDSALNPTRVFSKSDAVEQIKVRIDDKLSRIATSGTSATDEDTLQDLIGYLVLLKIATKRRVTYEEVLEDQIESALEGNEPCGVDESDIVHVVEKKGTLVGVKSNGEACVLEKAPIPWHMTH